MSCVSGKISAEAVAACLPVVDIGFIGVPMRSCLEVVSAAIWEAMDRHGEDIRPTQRCGSWINSFSFIAGSMFFWYDDAAGSTHMLRIVPSMGISRSTMIDLEAAWNLLGGAS